MTLSHKKRNDQKESEKGNGKPKDFCTCHSILSKHIYRRCFSYLENFSIIELQKNRKSANSVYTIYEIWANFASGQYL